MMMARWDSADKNGTSHVHYAMGYTCDFCHLFCWRQSVCGRVSLCPAACAGVLELLRRAGMWFTHMYQLPTLWGPRTSPISRHVVLLLGACQRLGCLSPPFHPHIHAMPACLYMAMACVAETSLMCSCFRCLQQQ